MKASRWPVLVAVVAVTLMWAVVSPPAAHALTFGLDYEFSDAQSPQNSTPPPWLTATITDAGANTVNLLMQATNLAGGEHVKVWLFNVDPIPNPLSFTYVSGQQAASILVGLDGYKADGDGWFDIQIAFPTDASDRFGPGESSTYTVSGTGLSASSFDVLSASGGNQGTYKTAAHVGGIPVSGGDTDGSGWIGPGEPVPEPATLLLVGGGLLGLAGLRRKLGK